MPATDPSPPGLQLTVTGPVFEWRGPAPHHFVATGEDDTALIDELRDSLTYGWGMVPVVGRVGATTFTTSLWPRAGRYVVPLKAAVRRAEGIALGDEVTVALTLVVRG